MKDLLMQAIPYIIAIIILLLTPPVYKIAKFAETKAKQILGESLYSEIKAFAGGEINNILEEYPQFTSEEIISQTLAIIEKKYMALIGLQLNRLNLCWKLF